MRLLYALRLAYQAVEARKEAAFKDLAITPAQYVFMINLNNHDGINGARLSKIIGSTPQNVASLSLKLEAKGCITRTTHPEYAGIMVFNLTSEGRRVLREADAVIAGLETQTRSLLGDSDVEQLVQQLLIINNKGDV